MSFSVWARGDSNTANNASLNAVASNQQETTLLTFVALSPEGDDKLDYNGGDIDPDTVIYADLDGDGIPEEYRFTLEFRGNLPSTNKLNGVGPTNADLRGEEVYVITLDDGTRLFFLSSYIFAEDNPDPTTDPNYTTYYDLMNAFPNGAHALTNVLICYAAGTLIATPEGEVPVELLERLDLVLGEDGVAVAVLDVARRQVQPAEMRAFPALRPVVIPAHLLGPGEPARDLTVSALHRILVRGAEIESLFGLPAAFVAARDLPGTRPGALAATEYVHFLCEAHVVVRAEGCESESLFPGDVALAAAGSALMRTMRAHPEIAAQKTAYPCLTAREAAVWAAAVQSREKRTA